MLKISWVFAANIVITCGPISIWHHVGHFVQYFTTPENDYSFSHSYGFALYFLYLLCISSSFFHLIVYLLPHYWLGLLKFPLVILCSCFYCPFFIFLVFLLPGFVSLSLYFPSFFLLYFFPSFFLHFFPRSLSICQWIGIFWDGLIIKLTKHAKSADDWVSYQFLAKWISFFTRMRK